ncbi:MAG: hypothetical protein ABIG61_12185 [Planctomycetota bacterium]
MTGRNWNNKKEDDGSIHCLGNSLFCVYEQGPDIIQIFGPPYSAPSVIRLLSTSESLLEAESVRQENTAIWQHEIKTNGKKIGTITDFVDSQAPCFIRRFSLKSALTFTLTLQDELSQPLRGIVKVIQNKKQLSAKGASDALLIHVPQGQVIQVFNPTILQYYYQLVIRGNGSFRKKPGTEEWVEGVDRGEDLQTVRRELAVRGEVRTLRKRPGTAQWELTFEPGESILYICGNTTYPDCVENTEKLLSTPYEDSLKRTRNNWSEFTGRRKDFASTLPEKLPLRDKLLKAIDDVSVLIKTQQGDDGGILAGHRYHVEGKRDQYGTSRCLLRLGYYKEAKGILEHYWNIWQENGKFVNCEGIGVKGMFCPAENDDVEITSYIIIQAFDYLKATKDAMFLHKIFPMLEWAWQVQIPHLAGGMLPFNGDETYVAGKILPRSTLNDGSAEGTMLFITASERLISWAEANNKWTDGKLAKAREVLDETRKKYPANFWKDGKLFANNPTRTELADLPKFRHGVCEVTNKWDLGWTVRNEKNHYVSPFLEKDDTPPYEQKWYSLKSVSLMPLYIGSNLIPRKEIAKTISDIAVEYQSSGRLPSRPQGGMTVGYDYGLLLYNLTETNHPLASYVYEKMLTQLDLAGAWVEYYEDGKPKGCRCRPWESGINLEAAINFAEKWPV